jgi:hypothetical protein
MKKGNNNRDKYHEGEVRSATVFTHRTTRSVFQWCSCRQWQYISRLHASKQQTTSFTNYSMKFSLSTALIEMSLDKTSSFKANQGERIMYRKEFVSRKTLLFMDPHINIMRSSQNRIIKEFAWNFQCIENTCYSSQFVIASNQELVWRWSSKI